MEDVFKLDFVPQFFKMKDDVSRIKRKINQIILERGTDYRCENHTLNLSKNKILENMRLLEQQRKLKSIELLEIYRYFSNQKEAEFYDLSLYNQIYNILLKINRVSEKDAKDRTKIMATKVAILRIKQFLETGNRGPYLKVTSEIFDIFQKYWTQADKRRVKKKK